MELNPCYFPEDPFWKVERAQYWIQNIFSLSGQLMCTDGAFCIITAMWQAIENAVSLVSNDGLLYVSIYTSYQGLFSKYWKYVKKTYNSLPQILKLPFALLLILPLEIKSASYSLVSLQPQRYVRIMEKLQEYQRDE